jgi:hypothetical protein
MTEPTRHQGEVIGFRAWKLSGHRLEAMTAPDYWGPDVKHATCMLHAVMAKAFVGNVTVGETSHDAPHPGCQCGLYAWHEPSEWWTEEPDGELRDPLVYGAVRAWGAVEVHAQGFRAEYAQIAVLAFNEAVMSYRHVRRLQALAGEFGLPLVEAAEIERRSREFGSPVPAELRPKYESDYLTISFPVQGFSFSFAQAARAQALTNMFVPAPVLGSPWSRATPRVHVADVMARLAQLSSIVGATFEQLAGLRAVKQEIQDGLVSIDAFPHVSPGDGAMREFGLWVPKFWTPALPRGP